MSRPDLLIIFARRLQAGQVKTRLIKGYGEQGALIIYRQLLEHSFTLAAAFPGQVCLCVDQHDSELADRAAGAGWHYALQRGADLGERMANALAEGLSQHPRVLLIGSDCVALDQNYLGQALVALSRTPVVFGASSDGGYVLLGSSEKHWWQPDRFSSVRFGGEWALADSRACFPAEQVTVLRPLWDVDEPEDVEQAVREGFLVDLQ